MAKLLTFARRVRTFLAALGAARLRVIARMTDGCSL
jgi:hypothetical protein